MICAWDSLIGILPIWMREFVDKQGRESLLELRLRIHKPPLLVLKDRIISMHRSVLKEDIDFVINIATRYSPWSAPTGINGYYTVPGGHRVGICGTVSLDKNGQPMVIQHITSLCIRVSRDFPGIASKLSGIKGSVLIIGPPGCGKTTFLRDYARHISNVKCVCVIDEKQEIFPCCNGERCFDIGLHLDVMYGCGKEYGINIALRNMGPQVIIVDEITAKEDCCALMHAGWCGVDLVATAHAGSRKDLLSRPVYGPILESHLFQNLVIMQPDKSWHLERI